MRVRAYLLFSLLFTDACPGGGVFPQALARRAFARALKLFLNTLFDPFPAPLPPLPPLPSLPPTQ